MVTEESIQNISNEYKGSAQERQDLLDAYTEFEGRLDRIYHTVMLSDILEDDERFRRIIDEEIKKGTVESFEAYERDNNDAAREKVKERERKRREEFDKRHGSAKEAAEKAREKQKAKGKKGAAGGTAGGSLGDLAALIQQRQKARMGNIGNLIENLEAKYGGKSRGQKRSTPMDEPDEEAFLATRAKLNANKGEASAGRAARGKKKVVQEDDEDIDLEKSEEEEEEEEASPPPKSKKRKTAKGRGRANKA